MRESRPEEEGGLIRRSVERLRDRSKSALISDLFLALTQQIPSSARDAESYRKNLFPEFGSEDELLSYLKERFTVDIGSGLTHENPYSLINVVARQTGKNVIFIGIEPKVGNLSGGFSKSDKLIFLLDKLLSVKRTKHVDLPAENRVVAAEFPDVHLPAGSVDVILSSSLVGRWIVDPGELLKMFKEFDQILSERGEIRLYPVDPVLLQDNELKNFIDQRFFREQTVDKRLVVLRRKHGVDKNSV